MAGGSLFYPLIQVKTQILLIVLREGIPNLEDIQKRLEAVWNERISLTSIRQILLENGLVGTDTIADDGGLKQRELFEGKSGGQMFLKFARDNEPGKPVAEECAEEVREDAGEEEAGDLFFPLSGREKRRDYSQGQREYLDQWERGDYNAYAGGLLFAPVLARYDFLPMLKRMIDVPPHEGYSLEELGLTLFYFDLFRYRSMEDFKRVYPEEFGLLVGRTCSPSLFTLRRFLHKVRKFRNGEKLIEEFSVGYLKSGVAKWGVLYIDGHFLPYHGLCPITKGWHAVRQMPMKGSYHFLGVDENFNPWIFLTRPSSEDLLQKIPEMVEQAKRIGKKALALGPEELEKLVVVFDREGYSGELFRHLDGRDSGDGGRRAIFITWAKYADKWVNDIPEEKFNRTAKVNYEIKKTEEIKYFETERMMSKYGKIRAIVIQSGTGKNKRRAPIFTNGREEEIASERVVQLICRRWGEENVIKELMTKHLINYMPGYVKETMEEQPLVDNPKIKELKKQRARWLSELHKLKVKLADNVLRRGAAGADGSPMEKGELQILEGIVRMDNEIMLLNQEGEKLPKRIRFDEAHDGTMLMNLNYEKKRILDCIKMFTYNAQKKMGQLLLNHYGREKEIFPALSMIINRSCHVKLEGSGLLRVRLRRFKNQEIDYAARHLCEDLNGLGPTTLDKYKFPMRFEVE